MNTPCRLFLLALLFLLTAPSLAAPLRPPRAIHKPNVDVYVYRRSYTPTEKVQVRLSAYNVSAVQFTAYKMDLPRAVKNSTGLTNFGKTLKALPLAGLPVAAAWRLGLGKTYPDSWAERAATVPHLPPGVYLIQVRAGNVEKRTWLDITDVALLVKRSRRALLVYATEAETGRPLPRLALTLYDAHRALGIHATDAEGVCRLPLATPNAVWMYGDSAGGPAFALSALPAAPEPFSVYPLTDGPIYRPGQTVQYKVIIRKRLAADRPGGIQLLPYVGPATIEIRDGTDALISRQAVTTNSNGSLAGSVALAPETTLGRWQIVIVLGERRFYGAFAVEAYRKPEMTLGVTFDHAHYLGGVKIPVTINARYFYGQPVVNAAVTYHVEFDGPDAEPAFDGSGTTDAQGLLHLDIQTQRRKEDRTLSVAATVTDLSRRTQTGSGSTLVAAGLYRLYLETDKNVYKPGERVAVSVTARDYDDRPVPAAHVRVRLIETKTDRLHRPTQVVTTRDVVTDARGRGVVVFASPRPGDLRLEAVAVDSQDDKIAAGGSVWVAGADYADYDYPTLGLVAGRTEYAPGESATLLLNTSLVRRPATKTSPARTDAWALLTVEGEQLGRHRLLHLTRRSTVIQIPLTDREYPSVSVNIAVIQDHQVYEQQQRLSVRRRDQKLTVTVSSDKPQYRPGETAAYTVTTRDYLGRPIPAELSLGVVDASIYALSPDTAPDLEQFFFSGQEVRIGTDFSFAAQYSGGAFQTMPAPSGAAPGGGIRVRRNFADTAYWNPFVQTDASGTARVSFAMPDNLTTWRATARGATLDTVVGSTTQEALVTTPLLVRLALPRFYISGDRATISALVQNYSATTRTVRVTLEPLGAQIDGGTAARSVILAPGGQGRVDWSAKIMGGTDAARFRVVADGGAGAMDAMELTLPVSPPGLKVVTADARTLSGTDDTDTLDLTKLPPDASVTLTLAPSLASSLFPALDYLTSYPYGCAEQTMSSFLPDIAVAQALRQLGRDSQPGIAISQAIQQLDTGRLQPATLNKQVSLGLQKLYHYQHPDGGWNWWENDQTDGDMTAYVLSGLFQAKQAGYLVDDQRIARGAEALKRLLAEERELGKRADWALALSEVRPGEAEKALDELYAKRDHLDTYGLASLCLALAETVHQARTKTVSGELERRAVVRGRLAFWTDEEGGYSWRDDNVAVTAHALRALLAVRNGLPLLPSVTLPSAVRWLMTNRQGNAWGTTRTTAEVVLALARYSGGTGELLPNFVAHVTLDGKPIQDMTATPKNLFDPPLTLSLTPVQLAGHTALTVNLSGTTPLYLSRTVSSFLPPALSTPQQHGLAVRRVYRVAAENPSLADTQASGTDIDVSVEVSADADYRYVQVEDPLPAGCEVAAGDADADGSGSYPIDSSDGVAGYTRREVRDNRVVFFFDSLPKGKTRLSYKIRAETPGVYQILPDIAALTYFPEIRGNSGLVQTKIGERP